VVTVVAPIQLQNTARWTDWYVDYDGKRTGEDEDGDDALQLWL